MSSPLKQNTTALQELLDKINQLPEAGIIPSGTLSITENGTYDVTEYASVEIDVEGSGLAPNERVYQIGFVNGSFTFTNSSFESSASGSVG